MDAQPPRQLLRRQKDELDWEKITKLFSHPHTATLYERHAKTILRICDHYQDGLIVRNLPQVQLVIDTAHRFMIKSPKAREILSDPLCQLVSLCGTPKSPFLVKTTSETFQSEEAIAKVIASVSKLITSPFPELQISAAETLADFSCGQTVGTAQGGEKGSIASRPKARTAQTDGALRSTSASTTSRAKLSKTISATSRPTGSSKQQLAATLASTLAELQDGSETGRVLQVCTFDSTQIISRSGGVRRCCTALLSTLGVQTQSPPHPTPEGGDDDWVMVTKADGMSPEFAIPIQAALLNALRTFSRSPAAARLITESGALRHLSTFLGCSLFDPQLPATVQTMWNCLEHGYVDAFLAEQAVEALTGPYGDGEAVHPKQTPEEIRAERPHVGLEEAQLMSTLEPGVCLAAVVLSSLDAVQHLKAALELCLTEGYRARDKELRNELLVVLTLLSRHEASHTYFLQSGLLRDILLVHTIYPVSRRRHPLLKPFVLTAAAEDFEMLQLMLELVFVLTFNVECRAEIVQRRLVSALLAHLHKDFTLYVKWDTQQLSSMRLLCLNMLYHLGPMCADDYNYSRGNSIVLNFLAQVFSPSYSVYVDQSDWIETQRAVLRLLCSTARLFKDELANDGGLTSLLAIFRDDNVASDLRADAAVAMAELCDGHEENRRAFLSEKGIEAIVPCLRYDARAVERRDDVLVAAIVATWCCVVGDETAEASFLALDGVDALVDLLEVCPDHLRGPTLSLVVQLMENDTLRGHIMQWKSRDARKSVVALLVQLWHAEEGRLGITHSGMAGALGLDAATHTRPHSQDELPTDPGHLSPPKASIARNSIPPNVGAVAPRAISGVVDPTDPLSGKATTHLPAGAVTAFSDLTHTPRTPRSVAERNVSMAAVLFPLRQRFVPQPLDIIVDDGERELPTIHVVPQQPELEDVAPDYDYDATVEMDVGELAPEGEADDEELVDDDELPLAEEHAYADANPDASASVDASEGSDSELQWEMTPAQPHNQIQSMAVRPSGTPIAGALGHMGNSVTQTPGMGIGSPMHAFKSTAGQYKVEPLPMELVNLASQDVITARGDPELATGRSVEEEQPSTRRSRLPLKFPRPTTLAGSPITLLGTTATAAGYSSPLKKGVMEQYRAGIHKNTADPAGLGMSTRLQGGLGRGVADEAREQSAGGGALSATVSDALVSIDLRVLIHAGFRKLGFREVENDKALTQEERIKLVLIERYLDIRVGEVYEEVREDLLAEGVRPVSPDMKLLESRIEESWDLALSTQATQIGLTQAFLDDKLEGERQFLSGNVDNILKERAKEDKAVELQTKALKAKQLQEAKKLKMAMLHADRSQHQLGEDDESPAEKDEFGALKYDVSESQSLLDKPLEGDQCFGDSLKRHGTWSKGVLDDIPNVCADEESGSEPVDEEDDEASS